MSKVNIELPTSNVQHRTTGDPARVARELDLKQLAVDRAPPAAARVPHGTGHVLSRYVLPAGMVAAFLMLVAWAAQDSLWPARPVTVVPVVVSRAEVQVSGTPLFQAAGWIEPRPSATLVNALAAGVVEQLLVLEGQEVAVNQPLARLVDADAHIAVKQAEAEVKLRQADVTGAKAALAEARTKFDQPVHLQADLAEAESQLAQLKSALANLPFAIRTAQAKHRLAQQVFDGRKEAGEGIPERRLQQAQSELEAAANEVAEIKARQPRLEEQSQALQRRCDALKQRYELKAEEARRLAEANAQVQVADAKLSQARLSEQTARLHLDRMTIRAPMAGKVLAVLARPGDRLVGMDPNSARDASNVVSLYDPASLQVRVDVRLEDVPQVQPGQGVKIETAAVSGALDGEVLRVTSQADPSKNTLQVKVSIKSPSALLKPDMLSQVTFVAPEQPRGTTGAESPLRLLVPRQLIDQSSGEAATWVADRERRAARRQPVRLGRAGTADLIEVVEGLTATDKLIVSGREDLKDGQRIRITGEEPSLGVQSPGQQPSASK